MKNHIVEFLAHDDNSQMEPEIAGSSRDEREKKIKHNVLPVYMSNLYFMYTFLTFIIISNIRHTISLKQEVPPSVINSLK